MDITQLATDLHAWHVRNYPDETTPQALLAVGEEFGELQRAELKQAGGIRGTWEEWQIEKQKEIGDVLIGLIEFAVRNDCENEISNAMEAHSHTVQVRDFNVTCRYIRNPQTNTWIVEESTTVSPSAMPFTSNACSLLALQTMLGQIASAYITGQSWNLGASIYAFTYGLCEYAYRDMLNIEASLASRWQTIQKRDFIAYPLTGGRENEV